MVPNSKSIKIILADGCYYEGNYQNHERSGAGVCYYPNGDIYEGQWHKDQRCSRGKMKFFDDKGNFLNQYKGTFSEDRADGVIGIVEDNNSNLF
jgi:hypothetical protein